MTNMQNGDGIVAILNLIDHAVIADTDTPAFTSGQFSATRRPRIIAEGANRVADV
jgi:hypothetical protein